MFRTAFFHSIGTKSDCEKKCKAIGLSEKRIEKLRVGFCIKNIYNFYIFFCFFKDWQQEICTAYILGGGTGEDMEEESKEDQSVFIVFPIKTINFFLSVGSGSLLWFCYDA